MVDDLIISSGSHNGVANVFEITTCATGKQENCRQKNNSITASSIHRSMLNQMFRE